MEKHGHMMTSKDPLDGRHWARNKIHWMVFRDDRLEGSRAPPFTPLTINLNFPSDVHSVYFQVPIVNYVGAIDRAYSRPGYLVGENVGMIGRILCQFSLTVQDVPALKKKWSVKRLGRPYIEMEFEIRVVVGDASLIKFEIWFNGRKVSSADCGFNVEVDRSFHDRDARTEFDRNNSMSSYATLRSGRAR